MHLAAGIAMSAICFSGLDDLADHAEPQGSVSTHLHAMKQEQWQDGDQTRKRNQEQVRS